MSKRIKLTREQYTIVDDDDYDKLSKHKWYAHHDKGTGSSYAIRGKWINRKYITINMARTIMNTPKGLCTDHKNHNTLDNRKENLRLCTCSQNHMNRKPGKNTSSKYKGVSWDKEHKKWRTKIYCQGKSIFLGYFDSELQASNTYDKKAKELFGKFAFINFEEKDGK